MMKQFIIERRSWILLFIFLQLLLCFVAYLDSSIPLKPILYIVFLSFIIFTIFLFVRYTKEAKFYESIADLDYPYDDVIDADHPFEKIVQASLARQMDGYKQELSEHLLQLEQEKDDLLAWIHEVKTPLTTAKLMIDRIDDESLKMQIMYEWLRIHLLLDQQLHRKRIPSIQNDLYIEKVALHRLINDEIKALQFWCLQKGIGFDIDLQVTHILTDAKWLGFIIRQFVTNAIKYSEASDIIIKSYIENDQVKLKIKDVGRGIDPKDLPRIFDKGFTSTTEHQNHAATGMGLYLTKNIAKELNILIEVESTIGQGTTIILTFSKKNQFVNLASM